MAGGGALFIEFPEDEFDEREEFGMGGGIAQDAVGEGLAVAFFKGEAGEAAGFLY